MPGNQIPPGLMLKNILVLESCPHCAIARPLISMPNQQGHWLQTYDRDGKGRMWGIYACSSCGKLVVATGDGGAGSQVSEIHPVPKSVSEEIPDKPKEFLRQAYRSLSAPAGAVVLCASAVDAMLTEKGYKEEGTLNQRIKKAVEDHLLTDEMGTWAHHVRLEAIDQRHPERNAGFPTQEQAEQSIEFTEALAEILFVLPSRVKRGIDRVLRAKISATAVASAIVTPRSIPFLKNGRPCSTPRCKPTVAIVVDVRATSRISRRKPLAPSRSIV
jgi:hypothetical protein